MCCGQQQSWNFPPPPPEPWWDSIDAFKVARTKDGNVHLAGWNKKNSFKSTGATDDGPVFLRFTKRAHKILTKKNWDPRDVRRHVAKTEGNKTTLYIVLENERACTPPELLCAPSGQHPWSRPRRPSSPTPWLSSLGSCSSRAGCLLETTCAFGFFINYIIT